jgi:hypothetical protein
LQFFTGLYTEIARTLSIHKQSDVFANPPRLVDHPKANARELRLQPIQQSPYRRLRSGLYRHLGTFARVAAQRSRDVDAYRRAH